MVHPVEFFSPAPAVFLSPAPVVGVSCTRASGVRIASASCGFFCTRASSVTSSGASREVSCTRASGVSIASNQLRSTSHPRQLDTVIQGLFVEVLKVLVFSLDSTHQRLVEIMELFTVYAQVRVQQFGVELLAVVEVFRAGESGSQILLGDHFQMFPVVADRPLVGLDQMDSCAVCGFLLVTIHLALYFLFLSSGPRCSASWLVWIRMTVVVFTGDAAFALCFLRCRQAQMLTIMAGVLQRTRTCGWFYWLRCKTHDPTRSSVSLGWCQTTYHARTMSPDSLRLCTEDADIRMKCLGEIIQGAITQEAWLRAQVSVKKGGFDIRDSVIHSPAAFLPSSSRTAALCNTLWDAHNDTPDPEWTLQGHSPARRRSMAPRRQRHVPRASCPACVQVPGGRSCRPRQVRILGTRFESAAPYFCTSVRTFSCDSPDSSAELRLWTL